MRRGLVSVGGLAMCPDGNGIQIDQHRVPLVPGSIATINFVVPNLVVCEIHGSTQCMWSVLLL